EAAIYENDSAKFTLTAYRLGDSTAALAAFNWQRSPKSTPSKLAAMAVETADSALVADGNYLFSFTGHRPEPAEVAALAQSLRNVDPTALPPLPSYLPAEGLVPNSERYVLGPASLAKFNPGIPPSIAAFRYGAEAVQGTYRMGKGEAILAVF